MKLLLYCTKAKPYLNCDFGKDNHEEYSGDWNIYLANKQDECSNIVNGKIVAECDFEVDEIDCKKADKIDRFYKYSRLTYKMLDEYLKDNNGYAIHIKNLKIFDEPKELSDCTYFRTKLFGTLGNAPQNMMYVYDNGVKKVLISIQSRWLCKILNGEKTIEIRKKVLKEMIK